VSFRSPIGADLLGAIAEFWPAVAQFLPIYLKKDVIPTVPKFGRRFSERYGPANMPRLPK
jgi:hypothetical protein